MTKEIFLRDLRTELSAFSHNEQEQIIEEYIALFEDKRELGLSDQEIIEELGNPREIATEFLSEFNANNYKTNYQRNNQTQNEYGNDPQFRQANTQPNQVLFIIMVILTIICFFWIFVGIFFGLIGILFTGIGLVFGGITLPFFMIGGFGFAGIAGGLVMLGLGLLMIAGSITLLKLIFNGIGIYFNWLKTLSAGGNV